MRCNSEVVNSGGMHPKGTHATLAYGLGMI
jgi:hypothetical protein